MNPVDRIAADPLAILEHAAWRCGLGRLLSWTPITTGFEDCNIDALTEHGRVIVKVFAAGRDPDAPRRIARLIADAIAAGVRHPQLYPAVDGDVLHHHRGSGTAFMVLERVDARDYYSPARAPTPAELGDLIAQIALIHRLDTAVESVADPWAVTNIGPMLGASEPYLADGDRALARRAAAAFAAVNRRVLPHVLIHADLTKGNVLADGHGRVHVIDFAVAGRHPRIQELAVLAANLTHQAPEPLPERAETIADLYSAANPQAPLTRAERRALPAFTLAAAAMEFLGAVRARHVDHDDRAEIAYLIGLGRAGLRECADVT